MLYTGLFHLKNHQISLLIFVKYTLWTFPSFRVIIHYKNQKEESHHDKTKERDFKKIEEINNFIEFDMQLGCGFAPVHFYDPLYEEMHELEEALAKLRHFGSAEEMFHDERGCHMVKDPDLPFM
ncbi:MAG: hypothetical protein IJ899_05580 [Blautia sp.]|nr:hypothetical protein [Blautia sp.]